MTLLAMLTWHVHCTPLAVENQLPPPPPPPQISLVSCGHQDVFHEAREPDRLQPEEKALFLLPMVQRLRRQTSRKLIQPQIHTPTLQRIKALVDSTQTLRPISMHSLLEPSLSFFISPSECCVYFYSLNAHNSALEGAMRLKLAPLDFSFRFV